MIPKVGQIWEGHNSGSHYEVTKVDEVTFTTNTIKRGDKAIGASNGAEWGLSTIYNWTLIQDVKESMELEVGQVWESSGAAGTIRYKILEIEAPEFCSIQELATGRIYTKQHSEYIVRHWHLMQEEEEVDMSFDEIVVDNHYGQIKLFGNEQTKYEIGSVLPDIEGTESYSIAMKEGGFVNVNQGILVSWTDTPGHRNAVYSKNGALLSSGDPDQDIWLEEHLQEGGYFYNPAELAKIIKGVHSQEKEAPEEVDFDDNEEETIDDFEYDTVVALLDGNKKVVCLGRISVDHRHSGDKFEQDGGLFTIERFDGRRGVGFEGGWLINKATVKSMTYKGVRFCENCDTYFYDPS